MKSASYIRPLSLILILVSIPAYSQAKRDATIEPGAKAQLVLQTRISSKLNEVGDVITATLSEPFYANGQLVMPRDAVFMGRIAAVRPAGHVQKSSDMVLLFDRVLAPWGEEPVEVMITAIDDWDNNRKLKPDVEGKVSGGRDGKKTVDNAMRGGGLGGLAAGTGRLGRVRGRKTLPGGGAVIAGGMLGGLLLTKGREVQLQPGTILRIEFIKALTLPIMEIKDRVP